MIQWTGANGALNDSMTDRATDGAEIPEVIEFARRLRDDPGLIAARQATGRQTRAFAQRFTAALRSTEARGSTP